jgi:hypothetical protein
VGVRARSGEERVAPIDDVVVIVAARDRAAHQAQHLAQQIRDFSGLPRILDLREGIEQRAPA